MMSYYQYNGIEDYAPYYGQSGFGEVYDVPSTVSPGVIHQMDTSKPNGAKSVEALQQMLRDLGYFSYETNTGFFGDVTRTALFNFLKDKYPQESSSANIVSASSISQPSSDMCQKVLDSWKMSRQPVSSTPQPLPLVSSPLKGRSVVVSRTVQKSIPQTTSRDVAIAPSEEKGFFAKLTDWWDAQSTTIKVAIGAGAAAIVGGIGYFIYKKSKSASYKTNFRRASKVIASKKAKVAFVKGKRWTRLSAPKRYRKTGATKRSDYAFPEHFRYPLKTKRQVLGATRYFAKYRNRYVHSIGKKSVLEAERRIGLAQRRFGIHGKYAAKVRG